MTAVIDASAAVAIALNRPESARLTKFVQQADWLIAPDIYISEVTNTYWKYHQFEDLPIDHCEYLLEKTIDLVDDIIDSKSLYAEAFALSCQSGHAVYDVMYLISARRYNGTLLTVDKKLKKTAAKYAIKNA